MREVTKSQLIVPTPLEELEGFFLKREDLNPSGSVKDRAIVCQFEAAKKKGISRVAISSSGNAGISAAFWAKKFSLSVTVFVSFNVNKKKLDRLRELGAGVEISGRPKSDCFKFCQREKVYNLRQSKDEAAIAGFTSLGRELAFQLKELPSSAVFFPVSSGATLRGVVAGFAEEGIVISPFVVQPASHPVLAQEWDCHFLPEKEVVADAIVARAIPCKKEIIDLVNQSGGGGVVVENEEIRRWHRWLKERGISVSFEGGMVLAGAEKARSRGLVPGGKPLCLLTGKLYE